ncbi:MAG: hypothetical protein U0996_11745, partial [Planctomycetaceae bacterium]
MSNPPSSSPRQPRSSSNLGEDKLRDPTFLETIQPSNFFHFCFGMVECWLFSRSFSKSLAAVPFLIVL